MSTGRVSLNLQVFTPAGVLGKHNFYINEVVLGRVNGVWRRVKIIKFEVENISGADIVLGAWQAPGTTFTTTKRFRPTTDQDLLPDNESNRLAIKTYKEPIIESNIPQDATVIYEVPM